jgi:hypothetical protein
MLFVIFGNQPLPPDEMDFDPSMPDIPQYGACT